MITASKSLQRLRDGNERFIAGKSLASSLITSVRLRDLTAGQAPFAVVLGCSDSRVPAELVFDQGFGDLFVVRVAGHVVAPSQIGSVEFALTQFGTRLVVVLGHTQCGAVQATLETLRRSASVPSDHLRSIVDRIQPAVAPLLHGGTPLQGTALVDEAVRANVRFAVDQLRRESDVIDDLTVNDGLLVVGAVYALETGEVQFLAPVSGND